MVDVAAMRDFMNISYSLSKLAKECIMRITSKKLYFIISEEESGPRKPFVWCELPADFYFKEYSVIGVNDVDNEIYLSLSTSMLSKSLSTVRHHAYSLKIKLTIKQAPCITLEIEQTSDDGAQGRQCVHDIPVEVVSVKYWDDYLEPQFNDFHVSIQMPSLKHVKNIVERMKNMGHSLIVSANKYGRLTLKIKTNMISLSAHFPDLSVESFVGKINTLETYYRTCQKPVDQSRLPDSDSENEAEDFGSVVSANIDIKKFLMFLYGMQLNNSKTICSIVHGKMVKLHLEQPGALSLQYFLTQVII
ncbi:mitotic and dna damage checkpoint protein hus1 [Holotrichia oblita]|uniref:Mitotic and dna damage checkpoint protein hus1 n=1 Tax=Holotrichia oblita TaxID=644536 RepID=A0ACB9TN12_HOLOL|nr:mitotic and dna damage checkpoint protein hus1 [Holotrichia oblita]